MARLSYVPDALGVEVPAPSGYYQPVREDSLDFQGRRLMYTLGTACIEASCCGVGSWDYLRVEGYLVEGDAGADGVVEVDTVEAAEEKTAIARLLQAKHPGVRVEFR